MSMTAAIQGDSLLLRATYPVLPVIDLQRALAFGEALPRERVASIRTLFETVVASGGGDLPQISQTLLGLHEFVKLARLIAERSHMEVTDLKLEGLPERYRGRSYDVVAFQMESPLTVVLHFPPEAWLAFGFALVALAERLATAQTRVSRTRARDLRDKAASDRERHLIEQGRIDMSFELLREPETGNPRDRRGSRRLQRSRAYPGPERGQAEPDSDAADA